MTVFVVICAAMLAAALVWILLPLWRHRAAATEAALTPRERRVSSLVVALAVPFLAVGLYAGLSDWDWDAVQQQLTQNEELQGALQQLEARLAQTPNDLEGWLLLGRTYAAMGRFDRAVDAYQHAYDLSKQENLEAIVGLGEALVLTDETALIGRAAQLFDAALAKAPNHPKALWYGSMAALQAGDLRRGRDRLQLLLAQNPPPELRPILERQIADLDEQLGNQGSTGSPAAGASTARAAATSSPTIPISVSIAPEIQRQLTSSVPLFILARDPAGGPPLAVQKHASSSAPLTVELSEKDAMMPSRTIASVARVQVVARLSRNGTPQAASGDFYGEADFEFGKDNGTLNIIIDRTVP